jgi:hypothetical protein
MRTGQKGCPAVFCGDVWGDVLPDVALDFAVSDHLGHKILSFDVDMDTMQLAPSSAEGQTGSKTYHER